MDFSTIVPDASIVAVIIVLAQVLKKVNVNPKFIPFIVAVLGIIGGLVTKGLTLEAGYLGLVSGLASAGLYDQKKILK